MTDEFMIGASTDSNPATWAVVEDLLSAVDDDITLRALDWSLEPYSQYVRLANGQDRGLGFPVIVWKFRALRIEQREAFRDYCAGLSNTVYIRTPTNETAAGVRTWEDYLCIMHWSQRAELSSDGLDTVDEVELTFTHCVAVV